MVLRSIILYFSGLLLLSCSYGNYPGGVSSINDALLYKVAVEDCDISSYRFYIPDRTLEINNIKEYKSSNLFGSFAEFKSETSKKIIITQLLTGIPRLSKKTIGEKEFYKKPFIYICFGSFNDKNRNESSEKIGIWQEILFNPFDGNVLIYINGILYKSGILAESTFRLMDTIMKDCDNAEVVCQNNGYTISLVRNETIETCFLMLLPKNGNCRLLGYFENAYFKTQCRQVNLIKNKVHLALNESSGKGTAANSHTLYILEIDTVGLKSKTVFTKEISGFDGPSSGDYWKSDVAYQDINQDSNREIVLTTKGHRSIFEYDKDTFREARE